MIDTKALFKERKNEPNLFVEVARICGESSQWLGNCVLDRFKLTDAVTDDLDAVQEHHNGRQMQHVCNESEQVHFKFKND